MYNIKRYVKLFTTNELIKENIISEKLMFIDLLLMAKSINKRDYKIYDNYNKLFIEEVENSKILKRTLNAKKAYNKRFSNYKVIGVYDNVTMLSNNMFFIVTCETKYGIEKYKFNNLEAAKTKFQELTK